MQQDVAAGSVYTFDAAGTIAFNTNGYNFAGTVAADTTTLVLSESTSDETRTFTAAAGVASVDDVAYATFADALAAITGDPEKDDFVTLLADVTYNVSAGTTLKVKTGLYHFTLTKADGVVVTDTTGADDVTTFVAVEGLAKLNDTWYATFDAAYTAASANTDTLLVKISDDFAPTLSASKAFASVTFTTESAEPIAIATASGDYAMTASTWVAPATATLTLSDQTVSSVTAGTVNVPEGVTLTLSSGSVFGTVAAPKTSTLTGSGTIHIAAAWPGNQILVMVQKAAWTGTLSLYGVDGGHAKIALSQYGNSGSKVRFNNVRCGVFPDYAGFGGTLELVQWGWYLNGNDYDNGAAIQIPATLKGNGPLIINTAGTGKQDIKLTGDIAQYTGHISFGSDSTARLCFGASHDVPAAAARCVIVPTDAVVQIPAGAQVTAPTGYVIKGDLTVYGTLNTTDKIYGSGILRYPVSALNIPVAGTWTGTFYGTYNVPYQSNAESTFVIVTNEGATNVINGVDGKFFGTPSYGSSAPTVNAAVVLNADWVVSNGYSGVTTTFAKLSGTGDLIVDGKSTQVSGLVYYIK